MNTKRTNKFSSSKQRLTRRDFMRLGGVSTAAAILGGCTAQSMGTLSRPESDTEARTMSSTSNANFTPDLELALTARPGEASLLSGAATQVLRYESELLRGDADAVQTLDNYLGPIIRVQRGQKVRIHFHNELEEESVIHWHGLIVPEAMDGHPRFAIAPGETYVYEFEVNNRAGTYWFHPHPHGRTGPQVYNGLAGLFLVTDAEEAALNLPTGEYDLPLVIQDRLFDADNQFIYLAASATRDTQGRGTMGGMNHGNMGMMQGGMGDMMAQMMGQRGDRILINGEVDASLDVATRAYRLRLLNGSNARVYKLAWSDDTPLTVIGNDGGLLTEPVQKPYITLAPGERVELWADFSAYEVGTEIQLRSQPFTGTEMGDMMGMDADPLPRDVAFTVLAVHVARAENEPATLPQRLTVIERLDPADADNAGEPYWADLFMDNMVWTINGCTFDMTNVAQAENMPLGALTLWEFANQPGRGMMADFMAHPMHIHGVQFQMVERRVDPQYQAGWETLAAGFVDEGWKDTVLVMPGETVRVIMRFTEPGLFVYHCHILEHEDMGMMLNYQVA